MGKKAEVVVIGGGVTGCSLAWHLTRKGCRDVILCEAHEIASGATAFAAGHVILYTLDATIARLNRYSSALYARLEAETGLPAGFHRCGNLRLATDAGRLDEFHRYQDIAAATGCDARLLDAEETRALWPLMDESGILGGLLNPGDGHIAPADLAQSLAAGARQGGARLWRNCPVTGLARTSGGLWRVETAHGPIEARHVVSATGNHAQSIAGMLGLTAQSVPVRHQYLVTEPLADLAERRRAGLPEMPVMRDPEQSFYCRQEGDALLVGAYDGRGEARFVDAPPEGMAEPFPDEMDKLLPYLQRAIERIPALATAGVRRVVNYAMPYTPDDLPTLGPVLGHENLWLAEGTPFGITLAGGIGWQMAEWILEGAPTIDMTCCDARRFGDWATRRWSARKVEEAYERTYLLPRPGEEMPAARGLRTTPLHDLLAARGARFGAVAGWERPNWFAPEGVEDTPSFERPNWHAAVSAECAAAAGGVALADVSHGAAIRVCGTGAAELVASALGVAPPAPGFAAPAGIPAPGGGIEAQLTVACIAAKSFVMTAAAIAEQVVLDRLLKLRGGTDTPDVEDITGSEGALLLLGPGAADRLARACGAVVNDATFPPGALRQITVGYAPVRAHRCAPFGLPGWRLHVRADMLRHVFLALEAGCTLIGARALDSLRLESAEPAWPHEVNAAPPEGRLVHLRIPGLTGYPHGSEPVRDATGRILGHTTSVGWGHLSDTALAFARVAPWQGALEVQVMGAWYRAVPTRSGETESTNIERTHA